MKLTDQKNIDKRTKVFIDDVVKKLESIQALEECDYGALYMLMVSYDAYIKASYRVIEYGAVSVDKRGNEKVSESFKVMNKCHDDVVGLLKEFGFTLKSREHIKAMTPDVDEDNVFLKFINEE